MILFAIFCWIVFFIYVLHFFLLFFFPTTFIVSSALGVLKFLGLKGRSLVELLTKVICFINKKINFFIVFLGPFLLLFFLKNCVVYERYCSAPSFVASWSFFFFLHINTIFFVVLGLTFVLFFFKDSGHCKKTYFGLFFSKCVFLSILCGAVFNYLLLLALNTTFAHVDEGKPALSGIIMLFRNSVRVSEENLFLSLKFSLCALLLCGVAHFYYKAHPLGFKVSWFLRINFITSVLQNAIFFESKHVQFWLVFIVFLWNLRFLSILVFKLCAYLVAKISFLLNRKIVFNRINFKKFNGFFGLGLIDLFNWRGIIKPLNWVYKDVNKSILVAEPTTEIIVAAKLKSIFAIVKTGVYLMLVIGLPVTAVVVSAIGGYLDIGLVIGEDVVLVCNSILKSTCSSFKELVSTQLELAVSTLTSGLDQTPYDQVPLRKCDQLVPDGFDAKSEEEVIRRRNLAREGWVYLFFSYVAGDLLIKLFLRLVFGKGDDDGPDDGNNGGPGRGPDVGNDTFVSW